MKLQEQHIYGSARLGVVKPDLEMIGAVDPSDVGEFDRVRGMKRYELSNHLGNVLTVISDRKIATVDNGVNIYYHAEIISYSDYYPFGAPMSQSNTDRTWSVEEYRFGFNGKESVDEMIGESNGYDFGARMYDARLGRWWSVDAQFAARADQSVYKSFLNNPNLFVDPDGNTEWSTTYITDANGTTVKEMLDVSDKVMTDGNVREVATIVMGIEVARHLETDYYDFETITFVQINSDGSRTESVSTKILYGSKKDTDWVGGWGYLPKWGDTKDPDGFNAGVGEQNGGFWLVSKGGGADPTKLKQIQELSDAEMRDVDDLITALDKGVKGSLSKPMRGEKLNGAEFLNRIFAIIEEAKNIRSSNPSVNSNTKTINQPKDTINVNYIKVTTSGNQVSHHHSSKNVAVKDTTGGIIKGDKTEIITKENK